MAENKEKVMDKIKQPLPCPFCGEIPKIMAWHGGAKTKRMVACENTSCEVNPQVCGNTRIAAVSKWNVRP